MTENNFQRSGSVSNAHVGRAFEQLAASVLKREGIDVSQNHPVEVGIGTNTKLHSFDLGSESTPVIVECKSHRWTSGNNVPSAKITVWNEAMYYFHCAPKKYRKIFFVLKDTRSSSGETLCEYYIRNFGHLIPSEVEIWEFDESNQQLHIARKSGENTE